MLSGDYNIRRSVTRHMKYGHLIHIETDPNGGASVVHSYQDELASLSPSQLEEFKKEYFDLVFSEKDGASQYVMGIVHGSAEYLPDLLEYFADNYSLMTVKKGVMGKTEIETLTMQEFK